MIDLAEGKLDRLEAHAIVELAQQIYNTLNVELRAATLLSHQPDAIRFIEHED